MHLTKVLADTENIIRRMADEWFFRIEIKDENEEVLNES
jgi:hypothetical protein